jgi:hypothetical protein
VRGPQSPTPDPAVPHRTSDAARAPALADTRPDRHNATAAVGALRYPALPAHIVTGSGHRVPKSVVSVLVVAGQLWITAVWSGPMLFVYRSRPDIEAADPAASALRYRRSSPAFTRPC